MDNFLKHAGLSALFALCASTLYAQPDTVMNCANGMCTIFEVTIAISRQDGEVKTRKIKKEYISPGETQPRYSYFEIVEKNENTCTKRVTVPQPVYESITKLMASLPGNAAEPNPTLVPSQQSVLLFYTTLMQQTLNFDCSGLMREGAAGAAASSAPTAANSATTPVRSQQ